MARRSDHSREELLRMALDAALGITEKEGLRGLSTRKVAAVMGYSPGTLYNVFRNRDALILHMNADTLDVLHRYLTHAVGDIPHKGDMEKLVSAYLAFTREHTRRWDLIFAHRLPDEETVPTWYQSKVESLLNLVESRLQIVLPHLAADDIHHGARVLWCGLHGICSLAQADKLPVVTAQSLETMATSLVTNYIAGMSLIVKPQIECQKRE